MSSTVNNRPIPSLTPDRLDYGEQQGSKSNNILPSQSVASDSFVSAQPIGILDLQTPGVMPTEQTQVRLTALQETEAKILDGIAQGAGSIHAQNRSLVNIQPQVQEALINHLSAVAKAPEAPDGGGLQSMADGVMLLDRDDGDGRTGDTSGGGGASSPGGGSTVPPLLPPSQVREAREADEAGRGAEFAQATGEEAGVDDDTMDALKELIRRNGLDPDHGSGLMIYMMALVTTGAQERISDRAKTIAGIQDDIKGMSTTKNMREDNQQKIQVAQNDISVQMAFFRNDMTQYTTFTETGMSILSSLGQAWLSAARKLA